MVYIICPHVDFRVWQVVADGSQVPLAYRYKVIPDAKVNTFKPKDLQSADDRMTLRSAQFGAVFNGRFNQLPRASHCDVVWEASGVNTLIVVLYLGGFRVPRFNTDSIPK